MKMLLKIIIPAVVCLVFTACSTVEMDWKQAAQANTVESYKLFLDLHPGPSNAHRDEANRRIEEIDFEKAKTAGNQEALKKYLDMHPDGIHKDELSQYVAYREAIAASTEKSYADFLEKYNQGDLAQDISWRLRKIRYYKVVRAPSIKACVAFITLYPEGEDTGEIEKKMLPPLVFQEAVKANNEDSYADFIKRFPDSEPVKQAEERLRAVRYDKACKARISTAYEEFLKLYPEGEDSHAIEKKLAKLRTWEQSKPKQLGDLALRMAPVARVKDPGSDNGKPGTFTIEPSPTLEQDFVSFRQLLEQGADPLLVHISGFTPAQIDAQGGYSLGNPGKAVPAEEGGITLMEYFKANKLKQASTLLEKYNKKKKLGHIEKNSKEKPNVPKNKQASVD